MIGVPKQRAEAAGVRQRERAARHLVRRQLLRAPALGEIGQRARQPEQVELLGVVDDRHDEILAVVDRDGDAEVDVALDDDVGAAQLGVDPRPVLDRLDGRAHDERQERGLDAVARGELLVDGRAHLPAARHVDLEERGDVHGVVDRGAQVAARSPCGCSTSARSSRRPQRARSAPTAWRRSAPARPARQARRGAGAAARRRRLRSGRGAVPRAAEEHLDVALGHAAAAAGARDLRDVEPVLGHHARDDGRHERAAGRGSRRWRPLRAPEPRGVGAPTTGMAWKCGASAEAGGATSGGSAGAGGSPPERGRGSGSRSRAAGAALPARAPRAGAAGVAERRAQRRRPCRSRRCACPRRRSRPRRRAARGRCRSRARGPRCRPCRSRSRRSSRPPSRPRRPACAR